MSELPGVEWVPVESLIPWTRNPKPHSAENVADIARNIVRFGYADPIVAWKSRMWVAAGHGRHAAVSLLYREDAGRLIATDQMGKGTVLVRWIEFASEGEFQAYAIANNRLTEANPMDQEQVADILRELAEQGTPIDDLGYTQDDLQVLLAEPEVEPSADDDEAPEPPTEPVSRSGEVYELGPHRLVCGDCTNPETVSALMRGDVADATFSDPPYNIDYMGVSKGHEKIANDKMSDGDFVLFLKKAFMPLPVMYVCCSWQYDHLFKLAMKEIGRAPKAKIVWDKVNPAQHLDLYFKQHEIIFYHGPFGGEHTVRGDIWQVKRQQNTVHPTMKPVELVSMALTDHPKCKIWFDGFGGSGTTLIACAQTGRIARLIELDPRYCDVIRRRWTIWAKQNNHPIGTGGLE